MSGTVRRLTFRRATIDDAKLLFDWRNDPVARENSIASTGEIRWEEHVSWLSAKLQDDHAHLFILLDNDALPIGQVRFDVVEEAATASMVIDPSVRGKGYGREGIKMLCDHMLSSRKAVCIKGHIKKTNSASLIMFLSAGFSITGLELNRGEEFFIAMLKGD